MIAIEENFKKVKDLRAQLEIEKYKQGGASKLSVEMKRIMELMEMEK